MSDYNSCTICFNDMATMNYLSCCKNLICVKCHYVCKNKCPFCRKIYHNNCNVYEKIKQILYDVNFDELHSIIMTKIMCMNELLDLRTRYE
jgi:hypothetical protein